MNAEPVRDRLHQIINVGDYLLYRLPKRIDTAFGKVLSISTDKICVEYTHPLSKEVRTETAIPREAIRCTEQVELARKENPEYYI